MPHVGYREPFHQPPLVAYVLLVYAIPYLHCSYALASHVPINQQGLLFDAQTTVHCCLATCIVKEHDDQVFWVPNTSKWSVSAWQV